MGGSKTALRSEALTSLVAATRTHRSLCPRHCYKPLAPRSSCLKTQALAQAQVQEQALGQRERQELQTRPPTRRLDCCCGSHRLVLMRPPCRAASAFSQAPGLRVAWQPTGECLHCTCWRSTGVGCCRDACTAVTTGRRIQVWGLAKGHSWGDTCCWLCTRLCLFDMDRDKKEARPYARYPFTHHEVTSPLHPMPASHA